MNKQWILWLLALGVVALASTLLWTPSRYAVMGLLTNEPWAEARPITNDGDVIVESAHAQRRPISFWIAQLQDEDAALREQAATALGSVGPKASEAVPDLLRALQDENPRVRLAAIESLGNIGPDAEDATPELIKFYQDRDEQEDIRQASVNALGAMGSAAQDAVPVLIKTFAEDEAFALSSHVQQAVMRMGPAAVPNLIQLLQDEEPEVRAHAAVALNWIGSGARDAVPALTKALEDEDAEVRRAATLALEQINAEAAATEAVE